jgi:thiol-disulfide isomerase/thioredoxin
MRTSHAVWTWVLLAATLATPRVAIAAETAVCVVCRVKEGATEPEKVVAVRTHEGVRYGLCSDACAKEFDADPAAYAAPAFPREAPALGVVDLSGKPLSWESFAGKVVLLDFWATWCAPCRKSMPELQALHEKYAARGFSVLGVSIDEDGPSKVKKFVKAKKIKYPIALDSAKQPAWERFKVKAVPAAYLIDREGRIVAQWTGASADTREVEEKLVGLLPTVD